jgi:amino acid transporter
MFLMTLSWSSDVVAVIILFSMINYRSVRLSGALQNLSTLGNLLIILLLLSGQAFGRGHWQHFDVASSNALPFSKLLDTLSSVSGKKPCDTSRAKEK